MVKVKFYNMGKNEKIMRLRSLMVSSPT